MVQGISVYRIGGDSSVDRPIYHTVHERNGEYLEKEGEAERFHVLSVVDDCDPTFISGQEELSKLIVDLNLVIAEADSNDDAELSNHLKEILVLCKLCLWNVNDFWLHISPYEYVSPERYPENLIEPFRTR